MGESGKRSRTPRAAGFSGGAMRLVRLLVWLAPVCVAAQPTRAQTLIDLYLTERIREQALELQRRHALRMQPLPPTPVPSAADTLRAWLLARRPTPPPTPAEVAAPPFRVERWRLMKKLERHWFEKTFRETKWAFLGSNTFSPLDTLRTQDLRARLEAHFGPPTKTVVELDSLEHRPREAFVEFEYWFIVNDTIPLILMDVNGPFERGLVTATDHRFRNLLFDLRETFLQDLVAEETRSPYVDYYYQYDTQTWFLTGFDGDAFFLRRIARPALFRGRPRLRGPTR